MRLRLITDWFLNLRWQRKTKSIRYQLVWNYAILIVLLVIFIGSVNLIVTTNIIMNNISYYAQQTIDETSDKIKVALQNIDSTSRIIANNRQIQQSIIERQAKGFPKNGHLWELYKERERINTILYDLTIAGSNIQNIHSVGIYFDKDHTYYFGKMGTKSVYNMTPVESQFPNIEKLAAKMIWIPSYCLKYNAWVFSLARNIVDVNTFSPIGTLVLNVESRYLTNILAESHLGKSGHIYLIDRHSQIVSSQNTDLIGKTLKYAFIKRVLARSEGTFITHLKGVPMLVAFARSAYTDWTVIGIAPLRELNSSIFRNQTLLVGIGILGLLFSLILSMIIAARITAPINQLRLAMKEVAQGRLDVPLPDSSFVETKELNEGFRLMLKNLRDLITRVYEEELREKEAQFKALQSQINPHFLYNTLDTINWMLIIDEKHDLSKLVTYLGDILRYNIGKGNNIITLEQEIEQMEKYLYIQKARFGDRISYTLEVEPATLQCCILKLLIQPLVENAIYHGIEKKRGPGSLRISSFIRDEMLCIQIEDDGVGMSRDMLEQVFREDSLPEIADKHTRLGIHNVNRRIQMYYGEKYGLEIQSAKNTGTCVRVRLPIVKEGEVSEDLGG